MQRAKLKSGRSLIDDNSGVLFAEEVSLHLKRQKKSLAESHCGCAYFKPFTRALVGLSQQNSIRHEFDSHVLRAVAPVIADLPCNLIVQNIW